MENILKKIHPLKKTKVGSVDSNQHVARSGAFYEHHDKRGSFLAGVALPFLIFFILQVCPPFVP